MDDLHIARPLTRNSMKRSPGCQHLCRVNKKNGDLDQLKCSPETYVAMSGVAMEEV
jgi:hypothetical protein